MIQISFEPDKKYNNSLVVALPLVEPEQINGRGWPRKSKMGPTRRPTSQGRRNSNKWAGGSSKSPSSSSATGSGGGCGDFHRLSWTVSSTVHVTLAVLLTSHYVSGAPPFFAICPPAPGRLRIHGPSSPVPGLQHWHTRCWMKCHLINICNWKPNPFPHFQTVTTWCTCNAW